MLAASNLHGYKSRGLRHLSFAGPHPPCGSGWIDQSCVFHDSFTVVELQVPTVCQMVVSPVCAGLQSCAHETSHHQGMACARMISPVKREQMSISVTDLSKDMLQDHIEESDFSSECKEEVGRDQIRSNQDYRCCIPLFDLKSFLSVLNSTTMDGAFCCYCSLAWP